MDLVRTTNTETEIMSEALRNADISTRFLCCSIKTLALLATSRTVKVDNKNELQILFRAPAVLDTTDCILVSVGRSPIEKSNQALKIFCKHWRRKKDTNIIVIKYLNSIHPIILTSTM